MPGQLGGAPPCPLCDQRVYFNEEKTYMGKSWHKNCFKCSECKKQLESGSANLSSEDALLCNTCHRKMNAPAAEAKPKEEYVNKEDTDCCPRCGKRVYFAEQIMSLGRKWHKGCFSCAECSKKVESASAADHDGELYCKSCYGRKFGPRGYGYAGGAGTGLCMDATSPTDNVPLTAKAYVAPLAEKVKDMNLEEENGGTNGDSGSSAAPRWGGGDYCPRCTKQVFIAEKRAAAGHSFHDKCFTCCECQKKLDSQKLAEKQGEIYCAPCYGKKFGPKGYGYGVGAGALQMAG